MKILMPQLGETVTEGTISAWHKTPGDSVEKDEMLLDVETDKVATEIPSPASGILSRILVPEGDTVDVGTVLAVIGVEGEIEDEGPEDAATVEVVTAESQSEVAPAAPPPASSEPRAAGRRAGAKLSPAVRRLLVKHQLDIELISGTGRDGRIRKEDVLAYIETQAGDDSGPDSGSGQETDITRIPFDRIRRVTAEHMVRSKATSPHVLQAIEAKFHAVDAVRTEQREAWREQHGYSLSYLPFIARAVCLALGDFPRLNASVDDQSLVLHHQVHLSIAVDLGEEGLVAPVIHHAGKLRVPELARRIRELADRAREHQLVQDDLSGGTYTLSNPGPFGTLFTAPIINQPQVAILSIDAISKRAVVEQGPQGDEILVRPVGVMSQSFDHRAVDGAYSAAFLARVKQLIETEDWSKEFEV